MRTASYVVELTFTDDGTLDRELVEADLRHAIESEFMDGRDRGYGVAAVVAVDVTP